MTDREMLELAARAAGIECEVEEFSNGRVIGTNQYNEIIFDPLHEPSDALRLAVQLRLRVEVNDDSIVVGFPQSDVGETPPPLYEYPPSVQDGDYTVRHVEHLAATMRAIVRAAAEIGKGME